MVDKRVLLIACAGFVSSQGCSSNAPSVSGVDAGGEAGSISDTDAQPPTSDAGPGVTPSDAGADAAVRGNASVTVMSPSTGLPVAAAVLFVTENASTRTFSTAPGSNKLTVDVGRNATLTVFVDDGVDTELETIFGVVPGDDIVVNRRAPAASPVAIDVTFPPVAGQNVTYAVNYGCGQEPAEADKVAHVTGIRCADNGTVHALVEARSNGALVAAAPVDVTAGGEALLAPGDWKTTSAFAFVTPGASTGNSNAGAFLYTRGGGTRYAGSAGATPFAIARVPSSTFPTECAVATSFDFSSAQSVGVGSFACNAPSGQDVTGLASPPPLLSSLVVTTLSDQRPSFATALAAPMSDAIATFAWTFFSVPTDAGSRRIDWYILAPGAPAKLEPPTIPPSIVTSLPPTGWRQGAATVFGSSSLTYDEFRRAPNEYANGLSNITGPNGSLPPTLPSAVRWTRRSPNN